MFLNMLTSHCGTYAYEFIMSRNASYYYFSQRDSQLYYGVIYYLSP